MSSIAAEKGIRIGFEYHTDTLTEGVVTYDPKKIRKHCFWRGTLKTTTSIIRG